MRLLLSCVIALALLTLLLVPTTQAVTMTMTLDGVQVQACDVSWEEGSCVLKVTETTMGDYTPPGVCTFFPQAEGIALFGARLEIDASALTGTEWLEVDLRESSGDGHTRLFVYAEGETGYFNFAMSYFDGSPTDQTMFMDVTGYELGKIVISGHTALIQEVRIEGSSMVALPAVRWGVLKARW